MSERPAFDGGAAGRHRHPSDACAAGWQIVVAGDPEPAEIGLRRQHALFDQIAAGARQQTILIWRSQPALTVTRSQTRWPGFAAATARLAVLGWPVLVRRSGGGVFPIGPGTVQIAMMARYPLGEISMDRVYDELGLLIGAALADFGVVARVGKTPGAFCDGRHDLAVGCRKIAGLAQHWQLCGPGERCVAAAASVLIDADIEALAAIVARFHTLCGQTIDIRTQAMTTMGDHCDAPALWPCGLPAKFLTHLSAAAATGRWRTAHGG